MLCLLNLDHKCRINGVLLKIKGEMDEEVASGMGMTLPLTLLTNTLADEWLCAPGHCSISQPFRGRWGDSSFIPTEKEVMVLTKLGHKASMNSRLTLSSHM